MTESRRTLRNAFKAEREIFVIARGFSHFPFLGYVQQMIGCRFPWYRHRLNLTICTTEEEFEAWKRLTTDLNEIGENGIDHVRPGFHIINSDINVYYEIVFVPENWLSFCLRKGQILCVANDGPQGERPVTK